MYEIAIVAGEASGDASGAALAQEIRRQRPAVNIWGAGGPRMRAAGVDLVADLSLGGAIGVVESLKVVPGLMQKYRQLKRELLTRRPAVFVPIDFGAFNLRLARCVRKEGIKVVYYFPPSSWRKELRNPSSLASAADIVVTPFPWSQELLRGAGIDARFVGHPLLDIVQPTTTREVFRDSAGGRPVIGILPGSRKHEICSVLPAALWAAMMLSARLGGVHAFIGAVPSTGDLAGRILSKQMRLVRDFERMSPPMRRHLLSRMKSVLPGKASARLGAFAEALESGSAFLEPVILEGGAMDIMAHSDLLIVCSGTATLEAAILGTPMIIVYNGPRLMYLEYLLRRRRLLGDFIGMPNIIAGRQICPELLGGEASPENIASAAADLMGNPEKLSEMRSNLAEVRKVLGEPGGTARAARIVLETAGI